VTVSTAAEPPAGTAHGDDLHGIARLHGGDGVTGVDRALERVRRIDPGDLGNLRDVQLGGDARQDVLAVGGRWRQDVRVGAGQGQDLLGHVLGQAVGKMRRIGDQHFGDAGDLRSLFGSGAGIAAGNQDVDLATAGKRGGDGVVGAALQAGVVVFGND
jgi:hypothetical protein